MGSDSRSPKARHRFSFSDPITRQKKDRVTTDDILESLTRQAELRQKLGEKDAVRLEEIAEMEDLTQLQGFNHEPVSPSETTKNRSLGHLVFAFMLLSGMIVVWLYSSISKPFDLASLNGFIQKSGVPSIFANQAQLGIIALAAVLVASWIRRRRHSSSRRLLSV